MKSGIYWLLLLMITCACTHSGEKIPAKKHLPEKQPTKNEKYLLDQVNKIETSTTYLIYEIDRLKIDLLKKAGEKHPSADFQPSINPFRYDLSKLNNPKNQEAANEIFIAPDGTNPSKTGKRLFDDFKTLRRELVKIAASTEKQIITIQDFNDYSDTEELQQFLEKELASKDVSPRKDKQLIINLYKELSLPNYREVGGKKQPWIVFTFKDWEITMTFSSLTQLQNQILKARILALEILKSEIKRNK